MDRGRLTALTPGMPVVFGGDRVTHVSVELAAAFQPGDRLIVVQETGDLLHVPAAAHEVASAAVTRASAAFAEMGRVSDAEVSGFFDRFANLLGDDANWGPIAEPTGPPLLSPRPPRPSPPPP